jgi:hypothetical protein
MDLYRRTGLRLRCTSATRSDDARALVASESSLEARNSPEQDLEPKVGAVPRMDRRVRNPEGTV